MRRFGPRRFALPKVWIGRRDPFHILTRDARVQRSAGRSQPASPVHESPSSRSRRPACHRSRRWSVGLRRARQGLLGGGRWVVVCLAGVQRGALGRGGLQATHVAAVHASVLVPQPWPGYRTGGAPAGTRAGADVQGVLRQFRVGRGGYRHQDGPVLQQRLGQDREEENHYPERRVSWNDGGGGEPDRDLQEPSQIRPAHSQRDPCLASVLLPRRSARRDGRSLLCAAR